MQGELDAAGLQPPVRILGINTVGASSGNDTMCSGRDLPWLQDTMADYVWGSWNVQWRDLVIVDGCNEVVAVYSLTSHDLGVPANYAELKAMLIAASEAEGN